MMKPDGIPYKKTLQNTKKNPKADGSGCWVIVQVHHMKKAK